MRISYQHYNQKSVSAHYIYKKIGEKEKRHAPKKGFALFPRKQEAVLFVKREPTSLFQATLSRSEGTLVFHGSLHREPVKTPHTP